MFKVWAVPAKALAHPGKSPSAACSGKSHVLSTLFPALDACTQVLNHRLGNPWQAVNSSLIATAAIPPLSFLPRTSNIRRFHPSLVSQLLSLSPELKKLKIFANQDSSVQSIPKFFQVGPTALLRLQKSALSQELDILRYPPPESHRLRPF